MRINCTRISKGVSKMKRRKSRNPRPKETSSFMLFVGVIVIVFLALYLTGCSSQTTTIKVPTPCEVDYIPPKPKEIDVENSNVGAILNYITNIVEYAKEVQPLIDNCVVLKNSSKATISSDGAFGSELIQGEATKDLK